MMAIHVLDVISVHIVIVLNTCVIEASPYSRNVTTHLHTSTCTGIQTCAHIAAVRRNIVIIAYSVHVYCTWDYLIAAPC